MAYLDILLKIIVSFSILNVWLIRANKASLYRAGNATSIKEEFAAYGLPESIMKTVGFVKCVLAILLLVSIVYKPVEFYAIGGICLMMIGAIAMHFKIGDAANKSMPAALFFVMTLVTLFI